MATPPSNTTNAGTPTRFPTSCTVFLPRDIQVEPFFIVADRVYSNSKQIVFTRIRNLRDVGEENVTLIIVSRRGVYIGSTLLRTTE